MVEVTRMDGRKILINFDMVETVENTPDTVVTLLSGRKLIIMEKIEDIKKLIAMDRKDDISVL